MATLTVTHDFVNGTIIESAEVDANFADVVTFVNASVVHVDGSQAMAAALAMGGFKITGLGTPTTGTDAATKTYADLMLPLLGGTMTGILVLDNLGIQFPTSTIIADDLLDDDTFGTATATTLATSESIKAYADLMLPLAGGTMTGVLVLDNLGVTFPTSGITIADALDEDDMASDSATVLATQQSIKAYADSLRVPSADTDFSNRTTTSTSFVALTNAPAVAVTTGTEALVFWRGRLSNSNADGLTMLGVAVSGASTVAAEDDVAIVQQDNTPGSQIRVGAAHLFTGLTAGANTFTMQARVNAGTGTYDGMEIIVIPL